MNKVQELKIKMARAVSGILAAFEAIVKKIPGLVEKHAELDNLIEDTQKFNQGQLNTGTELTRKKEELRIDLEKATISACASLAAYATSSNDSTLKPLNLKYQIADSKVTRLRDMQLFALSYKVYGDSLLYADKLSPFSSAEEVAALKVLADNFNESIPKKRTQRGTTVMSTLNLGQTIETMEDLLKKNIDVLIKPLEFKEVDFYKSYHNARNTEEPTSRKSKKIVDEPKMPLK